MQTQRKWFLIAVAIGLVFVLVAGFLTIGTVVAQGPGWMMGGPGFDNGQNGEGGPGWMPHHGRRGGSGFGNGQSGNFGPGWMMGNTQGFSGTNQFGFGPGWMMGNTQGFTGTNQFGFGPGWMMQGGMMQGGMMGGGMMGMGHGMMWSSNNAFYTVEPLTLADASSILEAYLTDLDDSNLAVEDIMIFDNHAYAQIVETDSGLGVMEVLVDPTTQAVYPEMGPNMMWNQKYGMMAGYGRYGMMGMMGRGFDFNNQSLSQSETGAEMPISPEEAVETAQSYLDSYFSSANLTADDHADPFYGYYTLHVNRDGETVGMLSVNGYSGQVFPHTWHGELLEMEGEAAHE